MLPPVILTRTFPLNTGNFEFSLIRYAKVAKTKNRLYFFVKSSFSFCRLPSLREEEVRRQFLFRNNRFLFFCYSVPSKALRRALAALSLFPFSILCYFKKIPAPFPFFFIFFPRSYFSLFISVLSITVGILRPFFSLFFSPFSASCQFIISILYSLNFNH